MASTVPVYLKLGSEFMPPLYEGTLLYMPITLPGASVQTAQQILAVQDKLISQVPEVASVFGKAGRALTATDPAPLEMIETVINLKPESEWRPGMTRRPLEAELDRTVRVPGVVNAWTMPIKARVDMLSTGIRTPVGIKVFGPKLETINEIGAQIEGAIGGVPGTRNVFAERVTGGYYLDFTMRREEIARYGLTVQDVEMVIESAIGGANMTTTIEGRERFPVSIRYQRELPQRSQRAQAHPDRDARRRPDPDRAGGGHLGHSGPTVIRTEQAQLLGYVYVDVAGRDIGSYVEDAKRVVAEMVKLPAGYSLEWSGQYQYMERAKARLAHRHSGDAADCDRPALLQHAARGEDSHRAAGRAVLAGRGVLADLPPGLQHERGRVGGHHRAGRCRRGDRRRHAALSRPVVREIQGRGPHEQTWPTSRRPSRTAPSSASARR